MYIIFINTIYNYENIPINFTNIIYNDENIPLISFILFIMMKIFH